MQQVTISLKDREAKALNKICEVRDINRHHAIKVAIEEYIKRFEETERHHRCPDWKLVECSNKKG